MAKFKVGDKVRILDGSRISDYYGGWTDEMAKHVGEVHEVENIEDGVFGKVKIYLCGLGEFEYGYIWDERGLELVTESKFKVGDKVRAKKDTPYSITTNGWVGTVTSTVGDDMMTVWGEPLIGKPKKSKDGFYVECKYFDLVTRSNLAQKVVITTCGKTTTAVLYNGKERVKTAKAECSPEDTFSLETGAKLALDRLFEKKADKPQGIDWDAFKRGELSIKVTRDKFEGLMKEFEERGYVMLSDGSKPTSVKNPWEAYENIEKKQDFGGFLVRMIVKELHVEPKEHLYIEVAHDNVIGFVWERQGGKLVREWQ